MYNFIIQSYATYRGLFYWLNFWAYISHVFLQPILTVIMFSLLGRFTQSLEVAQAYALGISVYSMRVVAGGISQSYDYDRQQGTIPFLYISPANRLVNYISRSVLHYPNAILCFTSSLLIAWVILGMDFGPVNWAGFIVAVLIIAASLVSFSQFLGILSIAFRDWQAVHTLLCMVLFLFTGVIIPLTVFPDAVAEFAKILPITNGLFALRDTFAGASFSQVSGDILREGLTGLTYFILGFIGFRLFEYVARRRGAFEE